IVSWRHHPPARWRERSEALPIEDRTVPTGDEAARTCTAPGGPVTFRTPVPVFPRSTPICSMASPAPPCPCGSGRTLRGRPPRVTPGRKRKERPPRERGFRPTTVLGSLAILLSIAGVGELAGQAGSRTTRFETELGASVFFGNTEQVTFSNRSG